MKFWRLFPSSLHIIATKCVIRGFIVYTNQTITHCTVHGMKTNSVWKVTIIILSH